MRTIEFIDDFRHADDGVTVKTYPAGQTCEVSDACAEAAIRTKVGREPGKSPAGGKAGAAETPSSSDQALQPEPPASKPNSTGSAKPKKASGRKS